MSLRRATELGISFTNKVFALLLFHKSVFCPSLSLILAQNKRSVFFHDNETSKVEKGICNKLLSVETDQLKFAFYMCSHFSFTNKAT